LPFFRAIHGDLACRHTADDEAGDADDDEADRGEGEYVGEEAAVSLGERPHLLAPASPLTSSWSVEPSLTLSPSNKSVSSTSSFCKIFGAQHEDRIWSGICQ